MSEVSVSLSAPRGRAGHINLLLGIRFGGSQKGYLKSIFKEHLLVKEIDQALWCRVWNHGHVSQLVETSWRCFMSSSWFGKWELALAAIAAEEIMTWEARSLVFAICHRTLEHELIAHHVLAQRSLKLFLLKCRAKKKKIKQLAFQHIATSTNTKPWLPTGAPWSLRYPTLVGIHWGTKKSFYQRSSKKPCRIDIYTSKTARKLLTFLSLLLKHDKLVVLFVLCCFHILFFLEICAILGCWLRTILYNMCTEIDIDQE